MSGDQPASGHASHSAHTAPISESSESDSEVEFALPNRNRQPHAAGGLGTPAGPQSGLLSRSPRFTFRVAFAGIHLTATTPTNSSVKLETSEIQLELSNRVALPGDHNTPSGPSPMSGERLARKSKNSFSVYLSTDCW